ncbi:MAG: signal peptidase I [Lachnospiraceae bacterium]|nr:signal peptidase I [Lachnospiraceae bacterium]
MKKIWNTIKDVLAIVVMLLAVFIMIFTVISVNMFDQNHRSIFGVKAFIVKSDSMSATDFHAGDIALIKECDPAEIKEGDIIAYISENSSNYGETVTHKVRRLTTDIAGNPGFITYGTTTDTDDEGVVTYENVLGRYTGHIPKLGTFFMFLKTTPGYICGICIPFMVIILYEVISCMRHFKAYRQEQLSEIQAERKKLEEEKIASEERLKRLQELEQQFAKSEKELYEEGRLDSSEENS